MFFAKYLDDNTSRGANRDQSPVLSRTWRSRRWKGELTCKHTRLKGQEAEKRLEYGARSPQPRRQEQGTGRKQGGSSPASSRCCGSHLLLTWLTGPVAGEAQPSVRGRWDPRERKTRLWGSASDSGLQSSEKSPESSPPQLYRRHPTPHDVPPLKVAPIPGHAAVLGKSQATGLLKWPEWDLA